MSIPVFVNGRFLTQRGSGIQRYAFETLLALSELISDGTIAPAWQVVVLVPPGTVHPEIPHVTFRNVGRFGGHAWEQWSLARAVGGGLLISFGPTGPVLKRHQIVTIHDAAVVAVPQSHSWQFRAFYRMLMPILARRSTAVMTVSEFAKHQVVRYFGADPARVHVSGEGWQHTSRFERDPRVLEQHGLRPARYVLVVGSIAPHKNLAVLGEALQLLGDVDYDVVVAGGSDDRIFGHARVRAHDKLKLIGRVSDAQLRSLYEHAGVFVFPSMYEGFGIPPLEAIAFGCPVIVSTAAAMPEVCGAGAKYFAPHDAAGLARAITTVMGGEDERQALVAAGREPLSRYSWRSAALSHAAAVNAALVADAS